MLLLLNKVICCRVKFISQIVISMKMSKIRRSCANDPNAFCYICGEYTVKDQRKPVTDFVKRAYHAYLALSWEIKIGYGLLIVSVKPALKFYDRGPKERKNV